MIVQTTLNFLGRTEEALRFYHRAVDAKVLFMMRFRESPDQSFTRPGLENKIFHATFQIGSTKLMASDCGCAESDANATFAGFSLVLRTATNKEAERAFELLSDGGEVQIPLAKTFFSRRYGIVVDRFGISWKLMVRR